MFAAYASDLHIISGTVVIFFGLHFLGVFKLNLFKGSNRSVNTDNMGFFTAMLFGIIFSLGWTPCVGAFLKSAFNWIKKNYTVINFISGIVLIIIGILMATGTLARVLRMLG